MFLPFSLSHCMLSVKPHVYLIDVDSSILKPHMYSLFYLSPLQGMEQKTLYPATSTPWRTSEPFSCILLPNSVVLNDYSSATQKHYSIIQTLTYKATAMQPYNQTTIFCRSQRGIWPDLRSIQRRSVLQASTGWCVHSLAS